MKPDIQNIIKSTVVLGIVAFSASYVLSHVNKITYPSILRQQKEKQDRALKVVLPGYSIVDEKGIANDGKDFQYWVGEKREDSKIQKGYAFITGKPGYSGLVKSMVGIDENGIILGIAILQQTETPGLGARSIEVASKETFFGYLFGTSSNEEDETLAPWFQEQFSGLHSSKRIEILKKGDWNTEMKEELLDKNAISAITGATITTRAVRDSIEAGIKMFETEIAQKKPM